MDNLTRRLHALAKWDAKENECEKEISAAWQAANEIERLAKERDAALGNADMNYQKWVEAQAEIERVRTALEEYACNGLANCPVQKLKDGTCIHAGTGHCGDGAFVALQPIIYEQ